MATTQSDPKAKAAAIEDFLTKYPQSVVKKTLLDTLIDTYQGLRDTGQDAECGQPDAADRSGQHEGHLHLGLHQEEPMRKDFGRADLR